MRTRLFIDSNVFIFGFERPGSNSHRILEMTAAGELQGVVTDRVVREVMGYFRRHYDKDMAARFRDFILLTCELVIEADLRIPRRLVALVGRKDAGALATVLQLGLSRLVSTDGDFAGAQEHRTPRGFPSEIGESPRPGDV